MPLNTEHQTPGMYYKDVQHMTVSGKRSGHNRKQWGGGFGAKETTNNLQLTVEFVEAANITIWIQGA